MKVRIAATLVLVALLAATGNGCSRKANEAHSATVTMEEPRLTPPPSSYDVNITSRPDHPAAGRETRVIVGVDGPGGSPASLEPMAGSPLHLVVVNRDLSWCEHAHPRFDGADYAALVTFPADGEYVLHVIFKPVNQPQIVRKQVVTVGASGARGDTEPASLPLSPRERASGRYTIRLRSDPDPPTTGDWISLAFDVSRNGQPVTNLTPTGTLGHIVIVRAGGEDFVYAHSTEGEATSGVRARLHVPATPIDFEPSDRRRGKTGPEVTFHTRFPEPGRYRMWVELQAGDDPIKSDFVVEVHAPRETLPDVPH